MPEEINVQFPNNLEVHSPQIDSIKVATETIANVLHEDLKEIIGPLQHLTELEELFGNLAKGMVGQFSNLFMRQLEATILSRMANISVLENKINYVNTHIDNKEKHLEEAVEKVADRYEVLADDIAKEHEFFLGELDNHAYEILDTLFQKQVQDKFSFDSMPPLDYLSRHASQSAIARTDCLNEGLKSAVSSVEEFQYKRNEFYNKLETLAIDELEEGVYDLPFHYVKTVNEDNGDEEISILFPWNDMTEGFPDDHNYLISAAEDEAVNAGKAFSKDEVINLCEQMSQSDTDSEIDLLKQYIENDLQK